MICTYFLQSQCRSCNLLEKSYEETLKIKEKDLRNLFPQSEAVMKPTIGLKHDASGSRIKAKFAVFNQNNELTFGLYHSDATSQELEHCPLHAEGINVLLPGIRSILKKYKIIPYDLKSKKGELKYLLISKSGEGIDCQFLLRFVLRSKESLDRLKKASHEIRELFPLVSVVTANIQPVHQAILEGDEEIVLTENLSIIHHFDEFKLALGARSFFQVTPEIARELYNAVSDSLKADLPQSLLDLYCGVGAFSFYASRHCLNVSGVEISKEAIECARRSLGLNNNKNNIDFYAMDVEDFLKNHPKKVEALVVNPPRRGLNPAIIKMIGEMAPEFIYYSSCNARTLAFDFRQLEDSYQIKSLQIFDMFPFSSHYETLLCLVKK